MGFFGGGIAFLMILIIVQCIYEVRAGRPFWQSLTEDLPRPLFITAVIWVVLWMVQKYS